MIKRNSTNRDIAVLQTDLTWIKGKLGEISETLKSIKLCTDDHEEKISKCESWIESHDKLEENRKETKDLSLKRLAIIMSAVIGLTSIATGVVLWALEHAFH